MITKKEVVDQISITENNILQVRTATVIVEDSVELSRTFHRHCVVPGQDFSNEENRVKAICSVLHTPEVISAYQAQQAQNALNRPGA